MGVPAQQKDPFQWLVIGKKYRAEKWKRNSAETAKSSPSLSLAAFYKRHSSVAAVVVTCACPVSPVNPSSSCRRTDRCVTILDLSAGRSKTARAGLCRHGTSQNSLFQNENTIRPSRMLFFSIYTSVNIAPYESKTSR